MSYFLQQIYKICLGVIICFCCTRTLAQQVWEGGVHIAQRSSESFEDEKTRSEVERVKVQTQPERTVSGEVTDENSQALPGVTVVLKGTTIGTSTDATGRFTLSIPDGDGTLVFSSIGFVTKEVAIGVRDVINVVLVTDIKALEEVVVVGYGTVKKRDLTGSVSTIQQETLQTMPMASIDHALQGQAPGLQVTQASGAPGSTSIIRIRGGNSINGGNEPLFVVDGIPMAIGGMDAGAVRSPSVNILSLISPNNIESIEILKDASATAIYGSRGANGVILITTKTGSQTSAKFNFDTYYGIQRVTNIPKMLNAKQYATAINQYNTAVGIAPEYTQADIDALGTGTNWMDEITRDAPVQNYQLSMRGKDESLSYYLSGGYFNQQGIVKNSGIKRYTLNLNLEKKVNKKLSVRSNTILSSLQNDGVVSSGGYSNTGISSVIFTGLQYDPTAPIKNADGSYYFSPRMEASRLSNPSAIVSDITNSSKIVRILENLSAEYAFTEHLSLKITGAADVMTSKEVFYEGRSVIEGRDNSGLARLGSVQNYSFLNENTLVYSKAINSVHNLNILAGITAQTNRREAMTASAKGFTNDNLRAGNLGAGTGVLPATSGISDWALLSYLGRVNYAYQDRLLLTATARYDGSSRFGNDKKYGFFPSASFAWRMSEEAFIKNMNIFDDLKLRISYGVTGSQAVSPYSSIPRLGVSKAIFGNEVQVGLSPANIANPQLGWEQTSQFDAGLDMEFANGGFLLSADVYRKVTSELLLNVNLPYSLGFGSTLQNMGELKNEGLEIAMNTFNKIGNLIWNANLNVSYNRNKLLSLGDGQDYFVSLNEGASTGNVLVQVGEPIGNFYGYVANGIFRSQDEVVASAQPTASPGDRKFKDISGPDGTPDGVISDSDRAILGNSQPKLLFGFTNQLSWKGFELSFILQGVQGNSIYNSQRMYYQHFVPNNNASIAVLDAWSAENPSGSLPRLGTGSASKPYELSSYFVEDGSYLRLKNVTIGYYLPDKWIRKLSLSKLKIYASGQDLATLTNYSGFDPEVSRFGQDNLRQGVDLGGYPRAKTYTIGLSVDF